MSSLHPGITDSMCEGGPEQFCAGCGHSASDHYEDEKQQNQITGDVVLACDRLINVLGEKVQCKCEKYIEGEYEPDIDEDRMKGI